MAKNKSGNKIVLGRWEMTALLINSLTAHVYIGFPRLMAQLGGTAAWIVVVYICLIAFVLFLLTAALFSKFEGKDILDVAGYAGGNIGRITAGIIYIAYIILTISLVLREFAEDMKTIAFTVTPISFVTMFFLAGVIFAAYFGIEAIARFHAIAVPVIIVGFLIIVVGVAPYYDATNLLPVLGNGMSDILGKGFFMVSPFSTLVALYILFPFVKTGKNFKKAGIAAIAVSSIIMLLSVLSYTLVYPYPTSTDNLLPVFQLARLINYGRFFQRIESVFVFIWAASALLYLSLGFFLAVYVFKKTFNLKYYRPLILSFAVIVFCLSIMPQSLMSAAKLETDFVMIAALFISFGLTLAILLAATIVRKGGKKEGRSR